METLNKTALKTVRGFLVMLVLAGMVVALLATANWLPTRMQRGFVREYSSVEEAKRFLGLETVLVPAYFPAGISWPPSLILAQQEPFRAVVMEFKDPQTGRSHLIVIQSSLRGGDAQLQRVKLTDITEETEYLLKGTRAFLQVGTCGNDSPCSRLTWQVKDLYCTVLLVSSPFELIKIAESMVH